jgi:NitT/TauT family transport system permease protein
LPAPKKAQTSNEETNQASEQTSAGTVDLSAASPTSQVAQESTDSADNDFIAYRYEVVESRIFSPTTLPSPWETFRSLPQLWTQRNLLTNILYSFLRVGAGFLVAFVIVFPISLLMGTFTKFHAFFSPLMLFGAYLPIPALVPLTMCFFGTNEEQKVMFLALGFAIYLLPLFVQALEEVDNVYLQTGYTLGATKFQVLNKIMLPIALPKIYDAMRLGFGIGWGYIILAEMVDMGSKGVGALILISQRRGPREDIYLVLIAIVVMAFITDKIWEKIGDRLFPYRSQER